MLKSHLSQKYLAFTKKSQLPSIIPTTPRINQCCIEKPFSAPVITAARSPNYKRKRIFQNYQSPQSKLTAKFNTLDESTVQPYSINNRPKESMPVQIQTFKKKLKTNKENGLNFQKTHTLELKKEIYKKTLNFKSQGYIEDTPKFNYDITNEQHITEKDNNQMSKTFKKDTIVQNLSKLNQLKQEQMRLSSAFPHQSSQQSLMIRNYTPQMLTFNSSEMSSLLYSKTKHQSSHMQSTIKQSFHNNHSNFIQFSPVSPSSKGKV